VNLAY